MTRLLLILALVCTGLAPSATCLYAAAAQPAAPAQASCAPACCSLSTACCCVGQTEPVSLPDAPATPPRGTDLAPSFWLTASPLALAWDDEPGHPAPEARYAERIAPREPKAVQRMICRWLT